METKELLQVISESETLIWEGAVFALRINSIDYLPSVICNIAEEHGLKVIGLFVDEKEGNKLMVHIKVNSLEIVPFANNLSARGFDIEYCSVPHRDENEIRASYKTLMDYLDLK